MQRCEHGVVQLSGQINPYCTGCCTPGPMPKGAKRTRIIAEIPTRCPECRSEKFRYIDQYRMFCEECGFEP